MQMLPCDGLCLLWVYLCACMQEAYLGLVDELQRGEESEDDEAVFARKNVKRLRKAEQLLAPTLLHPPAAKKRQQPQPQHAQQPAAPSAQQLPPEAQERYLQHMHQTAQLRQQQKKLIRPQQQPPQRQQQQHEGWQPSSEGFKGVGGLDDAKRQLREMVLMPLTYPDLYKSLGIHPLR
jgi:SpoVK/Ycf46/Vps4 family AAA+-type ATPase